MRNKLELGNKVFNVAAGDGKANPTNYLLEFQGTVEEVKQSPNPLVRFGSVQVFAHMEEKFLKPSSDGFCYYFNGFEGIESYKVSERFYKVPAARLLQHMSTYESPWE